MADSEPVLLSKPTAPISSSSACDVFAALPELGAVELPVAVADLSLGVAETRPLAVKTLAAALNLSFGFADSEILTLPLESAAETGAENTNVRTPVVPEHVPSVCEQAPCVISASFV